MRRKELFTSLWPQECSRVIQEEIGIETEKRRSGKLKFKEKRVSFSQTRKHNSPVSEYDGGNR